MLWSYLDFNSPLFGYRSGKEDFVYSVVECPETNILSLLKCKRDKLRATCQTPQGTLWVLQEGKMDKAMLFDAQSHHMQSSLDANPMIGLTNAHYWTRIILPLEEGDNINFGTPVKLLRATVTWTVSLLTYLFRYLWGVPFCCRSLQYKLLSWI